MNNLHISILLILDSRKPDYKYGLSIIVSKKR